MRALLRVLIWTPALAAIAGCSIADPQPSVPPAVRAPMATAEPVTLVHAIAFPAGTALLTPAEGQHLREFLATLPELEGGPPALLARGAAASDGLAERRLASIAGAVRQYGYDAVATEMLPSDSSSGDSVELVATSWVVRLPHCPDWSRNPSFDPRNLALSGLGCANATDLGLMIADPADLAAGRPLGPADGNREADAILRYRTDKVRPLDEDVLTP